MCDSLRMLVSLSPNMRASTAGVRFIGIAMRAPVCTLHVLSSARMGTPMPGKMNARQKFQARDLSHGSTRA